MSRASAPVRVSVAGLLRGGELAGHALLTVAGDAIELAMVRGRITLPIASIDGVRSRGSAVELYVDTGDVILLDGAPELAMLPEELTRRICTVPELTLSLRGLGSRRAAPGPDHDRFFDALLDVRRAAERAPDAAALRAAFDAAALRASVTRRLRDFAAERYPRHPPERRALEAELSDCAEGLLASLDELERAERALAGGDEGERFVGWRAWSTALRRVFECADACWLTLRPVLLEQQPPPRRARWRRWLRRGA